MDLFSGSIACVKRSTVRRARFDDLKIFPAKRLADPNAIVLGPGAAPSGEWPRPGTKWGFPEMEVPQNGWFVRENPLKIRMITGYPDL